MSLFPTRASNGANVFRSAAAFSVNDTLQAALFLPQSKAIPNFRTTALNQVLAVGVVVDHELDDPLVGDAATMPLDQTRDRVLDLKELLARAVLHRQVEEQMTVHHIRLPSRLALACPCSSERDTVTAEPLVARRTSDDTLPVISAGHRARRRKS